MGDSTRKPRLDPWIFASKIGPATGVMNMFFARESCSRAVIPLPKNLSRKIARFFVSKIGPATGLTTVAGPTFETKNRAIFSGELFSGEEFLEQHYCPRTLFPSMSMEWIYFPQIRTSVEKRFHGLFSKKKRSKSVVFLRFQKENTFGQ